MISIKPHGNGGRVLSGDTDFGRWTVTFSASASGKSLRVVDADGVEVGTAKIVITHPMPEGYDMNTEADRMKQGGCCGKASE